MARESTQIARASHQDSRALRIIQILSMLFLPASLVASIFGMGFFNTSADADGAATIIVSGKWWWYIAISIPLTLGCLVFLGGYNLTVKSPLQNVKPVDQEQGSIDAKEMVGDLIKKD